jgi:hypothetical protein
MATFVCGCLRVIAIGACLAPLVWASLVLGYLKIAHDNCLTAAVIAHLHTSVSTELGTRSHSEGSDIHAKS